MNLLSEEELVRYYQSLTEDRKIEISRLIIDGENGHSTRNQALRKNLTHKAIGILVFQYEKENGLPKPIHNIDVELWDRDITNPDDFLGSGKTGIDGSFEILYDPADAGKMDLPDLELRIYERQHKFDKLGNVREKNKLIFEIKGEDNVTRKIYDFGTCKIPYWEYNPDTNTPRVLIADEGEAPQSYARGRSIHMAKEIWPIQVLKKAHIAVGNMIKIETIQDDYPENMTIKMEKENPGSSRSDEFFAECMLNGMSANIMDKDPNDADSLRIHYHLSSYAEDDTYAMPNIDMKFKLDKEKLIPTEITIDPGGNELEAVKNALTEKITVKPDEGEKWQQAKRIARVGASLISELDMHLCTTHLNIEQYAIPAYRNIRDNPVKYLLFPHIKEVALINRSANDLLLGETGFVTRATGFSENSLNERIRDVVGTLDWKNWKPRKKLFKGHKYAYAAQLYWDVLREYIDWFFEQYDKGIRDQWIEIKLFSDELVENSVPEFMCKYLQRTLDETNALPKSNGSGHPNVTWFEWNERMDISIPRPEVNGERKAVSRITGSEIANDGDLENLKQVCCYLIHHSTFMHWWSNSKQYDEGGELRYACLGLRHGDSGIFTSESDDSVLPPPKDATTQLWISYLLSKSTFGFILKNEEKDINPKFLQLLKNRKKDFDALGINIEEIPSRTNI